MSADQRTPDWSTFDELIFANRKLKLIQALREQCGCTLSEALSLFSERYRQLRAEHPGRFDCDENEYWSGFYS